MATYAQLAMAAQASKDRAAFEAAEKKEGRRRTKAAKWGGVGRTLGLLGMGLATGGMGLIPSAIATGLGGLAGRSVGRALGGGRERDADKDVDSLFYQGARRKFGENIEDYQSGMRERMLTDTARDMFSAYTMGKMRPQMSEAWGQMKQDWTGRFGSMEDKIAMMDPSNQIGTARGEISKMVGEGGMFGEEFVPATSSDVLGASIGKDPSTIMKSDPRTWGGTAPSIGYDDLPARTTLPSPEAAMNIEPTNLLDMANTSGMSQRAVDAGVDPMYIAESTGQTIDPLNRFQDQMDWVKNLFSPNANQATQQALPYANENIWDDSYWNQLGGAQQTNTLSPSWRRQTFGPE